MAEAQITMDIYNEYNLLIRWKCNWLRWTYYEKKLIKLLFLEVIRFI
jgi:hypothetical protein